MHLSWFLCPGLRRRLALSLQALGLLACAATVTAQPVYRCGQTYTNTPPPGQLCEVLPAQVLTVIEGTRVRLPPGREPAAPAPVTPAATTPSTRPEPAQGPSLSGPAASVQPSQPAGADRQVLARQVLLEELARTRERLQDLQQAQQALQMSRQATGQTSLPSAESARDAARAQALAQALARTRRDEQSLQRELERLSSGARP